ncbi:MAG: L-aspartate oxidase [Advenella sp.]|uniref:L-aspartate oxidase n=1 Tax=Advenella sp. TaxID=1872388 RepID=UPI003F9636B4
MMNATAHDYDVLIVGGGLAGLSVALTLPCNMRIAIVSKLSLETTASSKAQGGIAAVLDAEDHTDNHIRDTLVAGAGLCDMTSVSHIVQAAPAAIDWLRRHGVQFTLAGPDQLHLTREAGHSHRRIVHAADSTGSAITSVLQTQLRQRPNVDVFEHTVCVDALITHELNTRELLSYGHANRTACQGIDAVDMASGKTLTLTARHTVLATGGLGQLFPYTTNPPTATGDGQAIAWRAGCRIANMEFIQFHPTALALPNAASFLISEAVRGEGGVLVNAAKRRFMPDYDSRAELAPRDIVARAIHTEITRQQGQPVWLDISHRPAGFIREHFPMIYQTCLDVGLDITRQAIPVAPAAHYSCGGIVTDLSGRTNVDGLYAVGEVADTGLHGANRLASNSLLECIVIGRNCARAIIEQCSQVGRTQPAGSTASLADNGQQAVNDDPDVSALADESVIPDAAVIRQLMGKNMGIMRTASGIGQALDQLGRWRRLLAQTPQAWTPTQLDLRNRLDCAWLIAACAAQRKESRGLHALADFPRMLAEPGPSVIGRPVQPMPVPAESEPG